MLKILADNTLPLLEIFHPPFTITRYNDLASLQYHLPSHDILLCRSTLTVNSDLLANTSIQCVATASSGIDHIDVDYLNKQHITLFDAKGCNAHAVADYVTSTLSWLFNHRHFSKKRAGVIGLGCVGQKVAARLNTFGFSVRYYDPLRAKRDTTFNTNTLEDIQECDLLCVHANLHDTPPFATRSLINHTFLEKLAPGTVLINASRGHIVDEQALLSHAIIYCTDVYADEPDIQASVVDYATLCTPHIAGHSLEAKKNAVVYLATQFYTYFKQPPQQHIRTYMPIEQSLDSSLSLEDNWLHHYDPSKETLALKQAVNKTEAFLALRHAHHFRHDVDFRS